VRGCYGAEAGVEVVGGLLEELGCLIRECVFVWAGDIVIFLLMIDYPFFAILLLGGIFFGYDAVGFWLCCSLLYIWNVETGSGKRQHVWAHLLCGFLDHVDGWDISDCCDMFCSFYSVLIWLHTPFRFFFCYRP